MADFNDRSEQAQMTVHKFSFTQKVTEYLRPDLNQTSPYGMMFTPIISKYIFSGSMLKIDDKVRYVSWYREKIQEQFDIKSIAPALDSEHTLWLHIQ